MPEISLFKSATDTNSNQSLNIDDFIRKIQEGYWQDLILKLRTLRNKDEQDTFKRKLPMVTVSGLFLSGTRSDKTLSKHSGFIQIDVDNLQDVEDTKSFLYTDEYVYAGFVSSRAHGLCLIFRINPKKHRDAFNGIGEYLLKKYNVIIDPTSINESRGRFVSYDPHLYYNPNAKRFEYYPEKKHEPKQIPNIIFTQSDFDLILQQIQNRKIDITETYQKWRNTAFAIADKFGESGRNYFHVLSGNNPEYNSNKSDRQYDACLKNRNYGGKLATIASIYYYAKQAGIQIQSEETRKITQSANIAKKAGKDKETAQEIVGTTTHANEILEQIFDKGIQIKDEDSLISKLKTYLSQTYSIKRNEITRRIEVNGKIMDDIIFNSIWCDAVGIFDKVSADTLMRVLMSDFIPLYNPFSDFFIKYQHRKPVGVIDSFWACIESDSGLSKDEFYPEFLSYFGKKWIVGIISAMHGIHSPLVLILSGEGNTGKTQVWRRFLPEELRSYYAESKLDAGKDDEILMTQKLIIMDDEMGGKSKKDEDRLKDLTSKDTFSLREPYGRANVDLKRIAVLCGTSNKNNLLRDLSSENRRIIPASVISIDYKRMNAVNRVDLFMEAYWLYNNGFEWELNQDDINLLKGNTQRFVEVTIEQELIQRYFRKPKENEISEHFSATDIKVHIERNSNQKTQKNVIILVMKSLGFEYYRKKVYGKTVWGYDILRLQNQNAT